VATPALSEAFPQQLAGLIAALAGMALGSLLPQRLDDHRGRVQHFEGSTAG
jgi:solute:Na+ symporter, SSS family